MNSLPGQLTLLVFDTIPILAVWLVSVSYLHSEIGISVGIMTKFFCRLRFGGNFFFEQYGGNSYVSQKGG